MNQHDRWFDGMARYLIQHAARKAPAALSERLAEEWLADLSARSGTFSQLRFALGCCWATNVIAHEFGAPVAAVVAASGGKTTLVGHEGPGRSFSRRTTVILVIVGLHVLVVCVLATTIVAPHVLKASPPPNIDVRFLPRPTPPDPPPPIDPTLTGIRVVDPPPPQWPPERTEQTTILDRIKESPPERGLPPPVRVNRVPGGPGAGFPNTDDFYPPAAIRARETGISTVGVCVDDAGRLIRTPTIDQSSGSARLDDGALRLAKAGSGHYRATTENGHPVTGCYAFLVRFQLRD